MSLKEIGERDLIAAIRQQFAEATGDRTLLGIGDDAAILDAGGRPLVVTTDAFAEWVHFRFDFISPDQVGAKCLAATVSDCAAMGCAPRWVTVALGAPGSTPAHRILEVYEGLRRESERYGCDLVGGDTISSVSDLSLTLTAIGEPFGERILTRSGAAVGDDLFVTGELGGPMAGLLLLESTPELTLRKELRPAVMRYVAPEARIDVARILATRFPVSSLIDLSDGLSVDLHHLARESSVGFHLERESVPILDAARLAAEVLEAPPEILPLHGGEEFELLFTLPPGEEEKVIDEVTGETGVKVTRIGTVASAEEGILLIEPDGEGSPLPEEGYEHFRSNEGEGE